MAKILEAHLNAKGKKFTIVVSRFNDFITEKLLSGALDALVRSGAKDSDIQIVKVDISGDRSILLRHKQQNGVPLHEADAKEVIKHFRHLWQFDVKLESVSDSVVTRTYECTEASLAAGKADAG